MTTRRAFLQTSLAATGGLASPAIAASGSVGASARGGCGLAIGTYGLQAMPLEAAIRLVAEVGFDAIEITAFPGTTGAPAVLPSEDRRRLRTLLGDSGVRLCGLMADLHPKRLEADHKKQLAELYHLIKLGHELSPGQAPVVQTVLGGKDWNESRELFRDRVANWVQIAADLRGYVSIKPHRSHAMSLPAEATWIIEQLGSPERLGMVYDYSHYAFREPNLTIAETVAASLAHTNYVAVKDAVRENGTVRFALAGEGGEGDHAEIVSAFHDGGYRGDFCCEVSAQIWKAEGYEPVAATKRCFENMKTAFEQAGVARR